MPASNAPSGQRHAGKAYTTKTGERRIRLVDLEAIERERKEPVYEVSLGHVLLGGIILDLPENTQVRISPINLKGMAMLEEMYGDKLHLLMTEESLSMATIIKLATVLVNQDRPVDAHLTEDEVGRAIKPNMLAVVNEIVQEMVSPLFAPGVADTHVPATGA